MDIPLPHYLGHSQLLALVESAPDGIFVADPGGCYIYVNDAGCRMLGYTREQLLGKTIVDLIRPEDVIRLERARERMLAGAADLGEWELCHRNGSWVPVEVSANILPDGQWQAVVRDVSARRALEAARSAAEREVRSKQTLLQTVFDLLPVGVWIADATGRLVSHNPAAECIWGGARHVSIPEFDVYRGWWLKTGKRIAAHEWPMARAVLKGETSTGELVRIQAFDGVFKTIIHSAAPLRNEGGDITGGIVVNEDVTSLHETQEKLRASERLFRTVFELLPVGLWIADREGEIKLANPAGEAIWEGTRYVGPKQFHEYKAWWADTGKLIEPEAWALTRAVRKGETSRAELIRIQCFDGTLKTVINWAAPIRSDTGEITGGIALNQDITTLQQTQQQLRAAVRERESILATVSHDLRNPLNSMILGALEIERLASSLVGAERVRELAKGLGETIRRMAGLVDDLLAIAVAKDGHSMLKLTTVPMYCLLERALEAARPLLARHRLELKVTIGAGRPAVSVDEDRILRVFANLFDNAVKFTQTGGVITLQADSEPGAVRVSIANSGEALGSNQLESMLQPFWQAPHEGKGGAGLGLSICRSIIEAHGGSIWAEPALGARVRLCFVLPVQTASPEARA